MKNVLINDPKHLIGISGSGSAAQNAAAAAAAAASGHRGPSWSASRGHPSRGASSKSSHTNSISANNISGSDGSSKRPVPVNGLHKPPANTLESSRRHHHHHHQSSKPGGDHHKKPVNVHKQKADLPKINPISSSYGKKFDQQQQQGHDRFQDVGVSNTGSSREKDHHRRTKSRPLSTSLANGASATCAPVPSSVNGAGKFSPSDLQNGSLPNGLVHHHQRFADPISRKSQAKHIPPKLSIPAHVS